MVQQVRSYMTI